MLKDFSYLKMEICLRAKEDMIIPAYHGSMLRGVIGQTLKSASCTAKGRECLDCSYSGVCPYTNLFFCVDKNENDMLTSVETVPNPFVIYSQDNGVRNLKQGENLKFYITIFGKAITYIHYFIYAIMEIENLGIGAERKKVEVVYIKDWETNELIVEGKDMLIKHINGHSLEITDKKVDWISLEFDTPLRVKDGGQFTQNITFHLIMRNILRRLAMIYEYHMDCSFESNYKELLEQAKYIKTDYIHLRWQKLFRYSSRAGRKLSIGGVLGQVRFKGNLEPFMPFIEAGQLTHIGKGCTLGLGHYNILKTGGVGNE